MEQIGKITRIVNEAVIYDGLTVEDADKIEALLKEIETEQLSIPLVSNTEGKLCDKCHDTGNFYLGTTCPKCKEPFRSVKA
jgi:hypothetical protein